MADQSQNQELAAVNGSNQLKQSAIPLELFLEIAEHYVDFAYARAATDISTWRVEGCPDALHPIYISDNQAYDYASQVKRWQLVSTLTNLCSKRVSDIVHKTFCRFPRHHDTRDIVEWAQWMGLAVDPPKHAWVLPEIDIFVLDFKSTRYKEDGESLEPLERAILQHRPTGEAARALGLIQNAMCSLGSLMAATETQIRALASLPNLKRIQTWCPIQSPALPNEPHDHRGILLVDPGILPDLAAEIAVSEVRLVSMWEPLFEAGVQITVQPRYALRGEIELVRTVGGLHMKFLRDECKCYRMELDA
ncbi:hypothetical protein CORC01_00360 [Colletotrichum orchidophilum]|uniref:Uncharacterized protein n=1 Tax=Colletotrichum orchidophilum TaxID=1209926 RepID=A0A1G4BT00_9PEZI|nr:uncharacterized protein CORC01_00360 [Colletotrichum orchidophilum]OHF04508.1 hypothetical protein CORC01_00360 [Colletotrichum orchidophilum]